MYTDEMEARFLAYYTHKVLRHPTVNLVHTDTPSGLTFASVFSETFQASDGQIQNVWMIPKRETNLQGVFQDIVTAIQEQTEASALVLALSAEEGASLLKFLRDRDVMLPLLSGGTMTSALFRRTVANFPEERTTPGYYTNGMYVATPLIFESAGAEGIRFYTAYRNLHDAPPDWQAAFGYDAARLIVEAIRYHAITGAPETIRTDRQKIRDYLLSLNSPDNAVKGSTGLIYFDAQRTTPRPASVGRYTRAHLLPAFVQLSALANVHTMPNFESLLAQEHVVRVGDQFLQKTQIAYSGVILDTVRDLDFGNLTFRAEGDLWFRYQGDLAVEHIEFLNAIEPVTFDPPLPTSLDETADNAQINPEDTRMPAAAPPPQPGTHEIGYQKYHFDGLFKMDFQYQHRLLGYHVLRVSFCHQQIPLQNLIYVVDEEGMGLKPGTPFFDELTQSLTRDVQPGWLVESIESSQGLAERHSTGHPLYVDLAEKTISFAQLNFGIVIRREQVALRNSLPFSLAKYATWFSGVMLLVLQGLRYLNRLLTRDMEQSPSPDSSDPPVQSMGRRVFATIPVSSLWYIQIPVVVLLVFAAEPFLIGWLAGKVNTRVLEQIVLGFDLLWWLVPAVILSGAVERFIWTPLEKKTERVIPNLMRGMVALVIYLLAFFGIVAFVFHRELTGLLATSGVLAMIIGLAVQLNIANIFSGIAINIERPFRIGDWVKIGDYTDGQVVDINWRTTRILMRREGSILSIPNNMASESVVVNYSYPDDSYALEFEVQTAPDHPPELVRRIMLEGVLAVKEVLRDPEPVIDFGGQGDSCGIYYAWFCVRDYELCDDYLTMVWESVWNHLERAGIELATPCRFHYEFQGMAANRDNRFTPLAILQASELFSVFPENVQIALSQRLRSYHVPAEATIITEGERDDALFFLAEGVVGIWRTSENGQPEESERGLSGTIIGETAFLTGQPYTETVVTLTESFFYEMNREDFAPFIQAQPDSINYLSKLLLTREALLPSTRDMLRAVNDERQRQHQEQINQIRKVMGLQKEGGTLP